MDTFEKLRENVAAALDRSPLAASEREALDRYAAATRSFACDGCDRLCGAAAGGEARIGDTLRYLTYHDSYGQTEEARALFAALPSTTRALSQSELASAGRACPHGVDVAALVTRARAVLA